MAADAGSLIIEERVVNSYFPQVKSAVVQIVLCGKVQTDGRVQEFFLSSFLLV